MTRMITMKECPEGKHIFSFVRREINIDNSHKDISIYRCENCGKEILVDFDENNNSESNI